MPQITTEGTFLGPVGKGGDKAQHVNGYTILPASGPGVGVNFDVENTGTVQLRMPVKEALRLASMLIDMALHSDAKAHDGPGLASG